MTTNPFGVVFAKPGDEQALYEHLLNLHNENGLFPINNEKVRAAIHSWLTPLANGLMQNLVGIIRGPEKRIEASIGLTLSDVWYSDHMQLLERWIYVEPQHRATSHAKNLVRFAKWYADTLNAALEATGGDQQIVPLSIGILTEKDLVPKMRLYQREGLQQIGATFMYPPIRQDAEYFNQRRLGHRGGKKKEHSQVPEVVGA